jgi:hypothetical protein
MNYHSIYEHPILDIPAQQHAFGTHHFIAILNYVLLAGSGRVQQINNIENQITIDSNKESYRRLKIEVPDIPRPPLASLGPSYDCSD